MEWISLGGENWRHAEAAPAADGDEGGEAEAAGGTRRGPTSSRAAASGGGQVGGEAEDVWMEEGAGASVSGDDGGGEGSGTLPARDWSKETPRVEPLMSLAMIKGLLPLKTDDPATFAPPPGWHEQSIQTKHRTVCKWLRLKEQPDRTNAVETRAQLEELLEAEARRRALSCVELSFGGRNAYFVPCRFGEVNSAKSIRLMDGGHSRQAALDGGIWLGQLVNGAWEIRSRALMPALMQVRDRGLLMISASFTYGGGHFSSAGAA